ncbi:MAG: N-acetylmuramoyl-L-alanine amidase, partial [Bacteroidota bacterium]
TTPPEPIRAARFLWCLDNGHGEDTLGKRSPEFELDGITVQFFEYEFNRDIVGRIIAGLRERGIQYTNVVPEIEDITLQERTNRANRLHRNGQLPVIFVSVHSNAAVPAPGSNWTPAHGIETWHHKNSSNGKKIAGVFQKHLIQATGWRNRKLKTTALRNLFVLNKTVMPAVLTENGFFNNKEEVKKLMRDDVRQAIADAHIAAIFEIERNGIV